MQRYEDRRDDDLIDLGAVSTETKGNPLTDEHDGIQLGKDVAGIADD